MNCVLGLICIAALGSAQGLQVNKAKAKMLNDGAKQREYGFHEGIEKLEEIQMPTWMAQQSAKALGQIFNEYWVFADIARDPLATPQSNPYGYAPFSEKVDIVNELYDLAYSFENLGVSTVPVLNLSLGIGSLVVRTRDSHVGAYGSTDVSLTGASITSVAYGNILENMYLILKTLGTDEDTISTFSVRNPVDEAEAALAGSDVIVLLNGEPVKSIDGMSPMQWLIDTFATSSTFPLNFKGLGVRLNQLYGAKLRFTVQNLGEFRNMKDSYDIEYLSGKLNQIEWVISMPEEYSRSYDQCGNLFAAWYDSLETINADMPLLCESNPPVNITPAIISTSDEEELTSAPDVITEDGWYSSVAADMRFKCFAEKEYCVLFWGRVKETNASVSTWYKLVDEANRLGLSNLVLDVNLNDGGLVETAYTMVHQFMPETDAASACNYVNEPIGPVAERFVQEGWFINESSHAVLESIATDMNALGVYAQQLMLNNCAQGTVVFNKIRKFLEAMTVFSSDVDQQFLENKEADKIVKAFSDGISALSLDAVNALESQCTNGTLNAQDLSEYALIVANNAFNPFFTDTLYDIQDPYRTPVSQVVGGEEELFTIKYFPETCKVLDQPNRQHPFKEILAMTNGYCGSSCDIATRTSYNWVKSGNPGPKFSYVAWGGSGEAPAIQNLTATSYPGGTQGEGDRLAPVWVWMSQAAVFKLLTSTNEISDINSLLPITPEFPVINDNLTPIFSKLQMFPRALGDDALPSEYYIIPADHYIKDWYNHLKTLWGTDNAEVLAAYDRVATFFA